MGKTWKEKAGEGKKNEEGKKAGNENLETEMKQMMR